MSISGIWTKVLGGLGLVLAVLLAAFGLKRQGKKEAFHEVQAKQADVEKGTRKTLDAETQKSKEKLKHAKDEFDNGDFRRFNDD